MELEKVQNEISKWYGDYYNEHSNLHPAKEKMSIAMIINVLERPSALMTFGCPRQHSEQLSQTSQGKRQILSPKKFCFQGQISLRINY